MPHEIDYVEAGSGKLAHQHMLAAIRSFATANGWTELRFDDTVTNHELILRGPGLSGTEQIFVGFRCYQGAGADYYNLVVAGFTGYVAGNSFDTQPGAMLSGVPAHNNRIDYWLTLNGQRIVLAMKVGTPVYESCYVGKMLPYATPGQFPYPLVCAGMLNGASATRFSEATHSMPFKGGGPAGNARPGMRLRNVAGAWIQPWCAPWGSGCIAGGSSSTSLRTLRDTNARYSLVPVVLHDNAGATMSSFPTVQGNVYGELDGVFFISGFNNAVENTLAIDGIDYVVVQDVARTDFIDYYAMRLDA